MQQKINQITDIVTDETNNITSEFITAFNNAKKN